MIFRVIAFIREKRVNLIKKVPLGVYLQLFCRVGKILLFPFRDLLIRHPLNHCRYLGFVNWHAED